MGKACKLIRCKNSKRSILPPIHHRIHSTMKTVVLFLLYVSVSSRLSCAWVAKSSSSIRIQNRVTTRANIKPPIGEFEDVSGRRKWLTGIVNAAIGLGCAPLLPANAIGVVSTASTCDQSVSVWVSSPIISSLYSFIFTKYPR